ARSPDLEPGVPGRHRRVGDDDVAVGGAAQDHLTGLRKLVGREALLTDDEEPQTDLRETVARCAARSSSSPGGGTGKLCGPIGGLDCVSSLRGGNADHTAGSSGAIKSTI